MAKNLSSPFSTTFKSEKKKELKQSLYKEKIMIIVREGSSRGKVYKGKKTKEYRPFLGRKKTSGQTKERRLSFPTTEKSRRGTNKEPAKRRDKSHQLLRRSKR